MAAISLTRGQVNAVRAAFKAGVKPALIARQFGISQSDVRKVLASNAGIRAPYNQRYEIDYDSRLHGTGGGYRGFFDTSGLRTFAARTLGR